MEIPAEFQTRPDPPTELNPPILESSPPVVVVAPVTEPEPEAIADLETLADELAADSVICGERHEEILECLERLEAELKSRPTGAELTELRTQIENLRVEVRNSSTSQNPSAPLTPVSQPNSPSSPSVSDEGAHPVTVPPLEPKPKKRRRI